MTKEKKNPPIDTFRDGAVSAKVWRNTSTDGDAFYSVTFQRVYTDAATGKVREASSFQGTDLLKVQRLASEAYRYVGRARAHDREQAANVANAAAPAPGN